ncbi:serine hydrolase [uncultured Paludibaculum sp.]|uniref:serine hydrolase n=1 Tax=uncultured Paludibaculum sp. TaxID=1765020 RepID=UPI002AAB8CC7|nr:serine hydrolase [uncultured Paludibaculum sp.]
MRTAAVRLAFVLTLPCFAWAQPNLDAAVERTLKEFNVPGIAVGVVKDGQLVLAKGYGVRKLGDVAPVTPDTLFGIASNTKAFTAASLAMLVDEGKVRWDDPVIQYLPAFQMYDPYVTREMTVRDLLVHRSGLGLGAGDLMFFPTSNLSSTEIVRRLRWVRPATSFRSGYAYDNVLYLVAGQVIEAASGKPWDVFVRERFFKPLGMTHSTTSSTVLKPGMDYATPHAAADGKLEPISLTNLDNNAPAGAINSSINDMSRWVAAQLNGGEYNGTRLFSAKQGQEMWSAQTIMPLGNPPGELIEAKPNFQAYGLGWVVSDFRGTKMVHHTGGLAGMVTRVTLIPSLKLGVLVFTNQEVGAAFNAVTYTVLDHYLNAPSKDWVAAYATYQKGRVAEAGETVSKSAAARDVNSKPSLPLLSYAGRFRDAWYGDVLVEAKDGKLLIRFTHSPSLTGELVHWQYDTFVARWNDRTLLADAYVTFSLKPDGKIEGAKMVAVSPLTDFSFDFHDLYLRPVAADAQPY